MVQVRQQVALDARGEIDFERWLDGLAPALGAAQRQRLLDACAAAQRAQAVPGVDCGDWAEESNCLIAGLDTAQILADLYLDPDCLLAGVLYRAVREERLPLAEVQSRFGKPVATLIEGVLRMAAISGLPHNLEAPVLGQAHGQKEIIRKMLIALVDDVRVALLKLAERTCALRSVKENEQRRRRIGIEVFNVYAPLAHRLGIGQLKWELEDLSFRYTHADAYRKIARLLDGKRSERELYIQRVEAELSGALRNAGISFEIEGRAKHIYSIWRKMQRKGIGFSQVYDIRALRIQVEEVADCYATLGLVHGLWHNVPNEFDDYIANPKDNGYRSLHTAVIGPEGKTLEVQIRTARMHEEAELGVCAHWRYKGSDVARGMASSYEEKIAWLRQVLDWHEETGDADGVAEQLSFDMAQDRVYVFTPRGDVISLAQGATPLDFAYHVHTEIGHRCRGAKVNGAIVPLTYCLQTGERVEILTSREPMPRRDWLQQSLGYLRTARARARVQHWFRSQDREDNILAGRLLLHKDLRRLALTSVDYQRIANKLQCSTVEEMYAGLGAGELSSAQVTAAAQSLLNVAPQPELRLAAPEVARGAGGVRVGGMANLLITIAGCCKLLPGENIMGFVTRNRGVSVHRSDCARLRQLRETAAERVVEVNWGDTEGDRYEVDVAIEARDRQGLLSDITRLFANARINVLAINTQSNREAGTATMRLRVEVPDLSALLKLLQRIERLRNVISVQRVSG